MFTYLRDSLCISWLKINDLLYTVIPGFILIFLLVVGFVGEGSQQFAMLANSFDHGHTYFMSSIGGIGQDPVIYHGKQYWDDGFFPAIILMPFEAFFNLFHIFFYQGYIKWILVVITLYIIYKLGLKFKYNKKDSLILSLAFLLASVYMGVNTISSGWLFAQIVTTLILFLALWEYFNRRRWLLLGLYCGLLFLTRIPASIIILFFIAEILLQKNSIKQKIINLFKLGIFGLLAVLLLGAYNYQRFGNPLINGNSHQLISYSALQTRNMGLISLSHIPTNLYTFLLRGPLTVLKNPSSWSLKFPYIINNNLGTSVLLTSPFLIYLFTKKWSKYSLEDKLLLFSSLLSLIALLLYYGDGANQFGYRYSLDFLPLIFVVFMKIYKKHNKQLTLGMKTLFLVSTLFNFYLVLSYIGFLN